jgi:hypothetical protein
MKKFIVMICVIFIAGYAGAQTKTAIKTTDLNKAITDHIAKNYAGYKVVQAFKVEKNKMVTYEVLAQKETAKTTLVYNDKGGFIKAEANKPTAVKKPVQQQKTTTAGASKAGEKSTTTTTKK